MIEITGSPSKSLDLNRKCFKLGVGTLRENFNNYSIEDINRWVEEISQSNDVRSVYTSYLDGKIKLVIRVYDSTEVRNRDFSNSLKLLCNHLFDSYDLPLKLFSEGGPCPRL